MKTSVLPATRKPLRRSVFGYSLIGLSSCSTDTIDTTAPIARISENLLGRRGMNATLSITIHDANIDSQSIEATDFVISKVDNSDTRLTILGRQLESSPTGVVVVLAFRVPNQAPFGHYQVSVVGEIVDTQENLLPQEALTTDGANVAVISVEVNRGPTAHLVANDLLQGAINPVITVIITDVDTVDLDTIQAEDFQVRNADDASITLPILSLTEFSLSDGGKTVTFGLLLEVSHQAVVGEYHLYNVGTITDAFGLAMFERMVDDAEQDGGTIFVSENLPPVAQMQEQTLIREQDYTLIVTITDDFGVVDPATIKVGEFELVNGTHTVTFSEISSTHSIEKGLAVALSLSLSASDPLGSYALRVKGNIADLTGKKLAEGDVTGVGTTAPVTVTVQERPDTDNPPSISFTVTDYPQGIGTVPVTVTIVDDVKVDSTTIAADDFSIHVDGDQSKTLTISSLTTKGGDGNRWTGTLMVEIPLEAESGSYLLAIVGDIKDSANHAIPQADLSRIINVNVNAPPTILADFFQPAPEKQGGTVYVWITIEDPDGVDTSSVSKEDFSITTADGAHTLAISSISNERVDSVSYRFRLTVPVPLDAAVGTYQVNFVGTINDKFNKALVRASDPLSAPLHDEDGTGQIQIMVAKNEAPIATAASASSQQGVDLVCTVTITDDVGVDGSSVQSEDFVVTTADGAHSLTITGLTRGRTQDQGKKYTVGLEVAVPHESTFGSYYVHYVGMITDTNGQPMVKATAPLQKSDATGPATITILENRAPSAQTENLEFEPRAGNFTLTITITDDVAIDITSVDKDDFSVTAAQSSAPDLTVLEIFGNVLSPDRKTYTFRLLVERSKAVAGENYHIVYVGTITDSTGKAMVATTLQTSNDRPAQLTAASNLKPTATAQSATFDQGTATAVISITISDDQAVETTSVEMTDFVIRTANRDHTLAITDIVGIQTSTNGQTHSFGLQFTVPATAAVGVYQVEYTGTITDKAGAVMTPGRLKTDTQTFSRITIEDKSPPTALAMSASFTQDQTDAVVMVWIGDNVGVDPSSISKDSFAIVDGTQELTIDRIAVQGLGKGWNVFLHLDLPATTPISQNYQVKLKKAIQDVNGNELAAHDLKQKDGTAAMVAIAAAASPAAITAALPNPTLLLVRETAQTDSAPSKLAGFFKVVLTAQAGKTINADTVKDETFTLVSPQKTISLQLLNGASLANSETLTLTLTATETQSQITDADLHPYQLKIDGGIETTDNDPVNLGTLSTAITPFLHPLILETRLGYGDNPDSHAWSNQPSQPDWPMAWYTARDTYSSERGFSIFTREHLLQRTGYRFAPEKLLPSAIFSAAVLDFNNDQQPDLVSVPSEQGSSNFVAKIHPFHDFAFALTLVEPNQKPKLTNIGDINGDNIPDLLVVGKTKTYIFYGGSAIIDRGTYTMTELDNDKAFGFTLSAPAAYATALGDVNGDNLGDLLFIDESQNDKIFVVYGKSGTNREAIDLASLTDTTGLVLTGAIATATAGSIDFNGDGVNDLVALGKNGQTLSVIFGGANLATLNQKSLNSDTNPVFDGNNAGVLYDFGLDISEIHDVGDINGDGIGDMVILLSTSDLGHTAVFLYGSRDLVASDTPKTLLTWPTADTALQINFNADQGFLLSISSTVGIGIVMPIGDLNGDGYDDVMIGAQHHSVALGFGSARGLNPLDGFDGTIDNHFVFSPTYVSSIVFSVGGASSPAQGSNDVEVTVTIDSPVYGIDVGSIPTDMTDDDWLHFVHDDNPAQILKFKAVSNTHASLTDAVNELVVTLTLDIPDEAQPGNYRLALGEGTDHWLTAGGARLPDPSLAIQLYSAGDLLRFNVREKPQTAGQLEVDYRDLFAHFQALADYAASDDSSVSSAFTADGI